MKTIKLDQLKKNEKATIDHIECTSPKIKRTLINAGFIKSRKISLLYVAPFNSQYAFRIGNRISCIPKTLLKNIFVNRF